MPRLSKGVAALALTLLMAGCTTMQPAQLQGSVNYRERIALPAEAEVRVALEELDAGGSPPRMVAEQSIEPKGQVPVPFALTYDRRAIEPQTRYQLSAEIRGSTSQLLWRSKDPVDPFATGTPANIELLVKRVGGIDKPLPTWHYRCDDVDFTFAPGSDDNAGLYFDNRNYQVKRVPSASGARYEGEGVMFWSKGRDGMLNVGGKTFAGCNGEPQGDAVVDEEDERP